MGGDREVFQTTGTRPDPASAEVTKACMYLVVPQHDPKKAKTRTCAVNRLTEAYGYPLGSLSIYCTTTVTEFRRL
jgi:hypothetical protein